LLQISDGPFGQCHCLSMDCGATAAAFAYGVKLPATKGADVIDQTGLVSLQEGAPGNRMLFLLTFVLGQFSFDLTLKGRRKAPNPFPDDQPLQCIGIDIAHICAAIGAAYLTDSLSLELLRIPFKAFIDLYQLLLLCIPLHGLFCLWRRLS